MPDEVARLRGEIDYLSATVEAYKETVFRLTAERDAAYNKGREDLLDEQREERICDEECR